MAMFNFAHLLGRSASASAQEDEKEKSKKAKARRAEDDEDKEKDPDAEEDDDSDPDASEDDNDNSDDEDKEKSRKGKKARAEEDDDDDESRDVKKGRKAERNRCAAIFASQHAAGRPALAASLAFNTSISAKDAINVLAASGIEAIGSRVSLDTRMQQLPSVKIGPDGGTEGNSASALVNKMTGLYNQAKGKK